LVILLPLLLRETGRLATEMMPGVTHTSELQ